MSDAILREWRTESVIRSYDVGPGWLARLPVICQRMQDAAMHHAEHFGLGHSFLGARNMAWALARQRIRIDSMPKLGDLVRIRTWPSRMDRLFFYRDFEVTDADGRVLVLATTAWFVFDLAKRERQHPDAFLEVELPIGPPVLGEKPARLKGCELPSRGPVIQVGYGDLDFNEHVNNVRYIEWVLNSLPLEFHRAHALRELEANYLAEALYGNEITVGTLETAPLTFAHDIRAGASELFRARSVWQKS